MKQIKLILSLIFILSLAQTRSLGQNEIQINQKMKEAILDSIISEIDKAYVVIETADKMILKLETKRNKGDYNEIRLLSKFLNEIEQDCKSVYNDLHFGLSQVHNTNEPEGDTKSNMQAEMMEVFFREINFGFMEIKILPGNVGYLKLNCFPSVQEAASIANSVMGFFQNTDALIIDLRENGGGYPSMVRLLMTYFFNTREHFGNLYQREGDITLQSWTSDFVPGKRLSKVLLYVLTSRTTCSAAEGFSFGLKNLNRATIVGENTSGGGHTASNRHIRFEDFDIIISLPICWAFDPKTGKGFEKSGVFPDMKTDSEKAFSEAYNLALDSLLLSPKNEMHKKSLIRAKKTAGKQSDIIQNHQF